MEIKNNVVVMNFLEGDIEANKQQVLELAKDSSQSILLSSNRQKTETINNPIVLDLLNGKDGYTNIEATDTLLEKLNVENFSKIGTHNLRNHAMAIAGNGPIDRQKALINELKDELNITEVAVKNRKVLAIKTTDFADKTYCKLEYGNAGAEAMQLGEDGSVLNFKLADNDLADKLTNKTKVYITGLNGQGDVPPEEWAETFDLELTPSYSAFLDGLYDCSHDFGEIGDYLDSWLKQAGFFANYVSGKLELLGKFEYKFAVKHEQFGEPVGTLVISGFDEEV